MSKLSVLRSRLAALRRRRQLARWVCGVTAIVIAALCALLFIFALDVIFDLNLIQRGVVVVLALAGFGAAVWYWALPYFGMRESLAEVALQVEGAQGIDSDLIAALEFESPEAARWGSVQLESAVVDYVGDLGRDLDVSHNMRRTQAWIRTGILAGVVLLCAAVVLIFPSYVSAFFERIAFQRSPYPTRTIIQTVAVNNDLVLLREDHRDIQPRATRSAEAQPVDFFVVCRGEQPENDVLIELGRAEPLTMKKLSPGERRGRLSQLHSEITAFTANDLSAKNVGQAVRLARSAATWLQLEEALAAAKKSGEKDKTRQGNRELAASLTKAAQDGKVDSQLLNQASRAVNGLLTANRAADESEAGVLFHAQLRHLTGGLEYQVRAGDAYTYPAAVEMIDLPIVQPYIARQLPAFATESGAAADWEDFSSNFENDLLKGLSVENEHLSFDDAVARTSRRGPATGGDDKNPLDAWVNRLRQRYGFSTSRSASFLTGSKVLLCVRAKNKSLRRVALVIEQQGKKTEYALRSADKDRRVWIFDQADTPLAPLQEPLAYELVVEDQDYLAPSRPIKGYLAAQPDLAPFVTAKVITTVVRKDAAPMIEFRAGDDYGLRALAVHVQVERAGAIVIDREDPITEYYPVAENGRGPSDSPRSLPLPIRAADLPIRGFHPLDLVKYEEAVGDVIHIALRVTDLAGAKSQSATLDLEVGDRSSVVSVVLKDDEESEKTMTRIIGRLLEFDDDEQPPP